MDTNGEDEARQGTARGGGEGSREDARCREHEAGCENTRGGGATVVTGAGRHRKPEPDEPAGECEVGWWKDALDEVGDREELWMIAWAWEKAYPGESGDAAVSGWTYWD